jgi:hypothetical protein
MRLPHVIHYIAGLHAVTQLPDHFITLRLAAFKYASPHSSTPRRIQEYSRIQHMESHEHAETPTHRHIHDKLLREFTSSHLKGPQEDFFFQGGEVSEAGFNDLKRVLQNAARQCAQVIEHERVPRAERDGAAFVLALRRWNYRGFARFKRFDGIAADPK